MANEGELNQLKQAFALFDKDNDGRITTAELGEVLRSAGANPTEEQLNQMVTEADTNNNGVIEFDEFVNLVARLQATLAR